MALFNFYILQNAFQFLKYLSDWKIPDISTLCGGALVQVRVQKRWVCVSRHYLGHQH